jgi:hypothetical protein
MNDRPTPSELLEAVASFLSDEVVPALEGKLRYNARVAAHVVETVRREIESEERQLAAEWRRLCELEGCELPLPESREVVKEQIHLRTEALVERIRRGDADSGTWREALLAHLKQTVADKLEVAKGQH